MASNATTEPFAPLKHRWAWLLRQRWFVLAVEIGTALVFIGMCVLAYSLLDQPDDDLLSPYVTPALLLGILVPALFLMILAARRIAKRRAARSPVGGNGRLHLRLVALFSGIAAVPTLLVVILASVLFQLGVEFWFSERARSTLENAGSLAQDFYVESLEEVEAETRTMAQDLGGLLQNLPFDSPEFVENFAFQVYARELSDAAIFTVSEEGDVRTLALVNPDESSLESRLTAALLARLDSENLSAVNDAGNRFEAIARFGEDSDLLIYASRVSDPQMQVQTERAQSILRDYDQLLDRARLVQLRFNLALVAIFFLVVGVAIWVALTVADRLVRPVGALVEAARKVAAGDLTTRVAESGRQDEIDTLARAFNGMTGTLEEQTSELVTANDQLDSRRAFTEAVLSSVTAGVISVDGARAIRLVNRSAAGMMDIDEDEMLGRPLAAIAPELAELLESGKRQSVIQIAVEGEPRTLAVTVVEDQGGYVLTFDDITQQLLDQRRAAWSDVARRIAHEIKNPLTPIQLAAERLERRFGSIVDPEDSGVFSKLTGTIVRQVGDLRRMVDEFSSFARMPKPVFREESVVDLLRQAVFLHEVAHSEIEFLLDAPDDLPPLVCDRRQLGQALTNVVKNAVEAVEQKFGGEGKGGRIEVGASLEGTRLEIRIVDNGIGLPEERERLTEPYMTTRERGTGLGLAIVKKIVEEHFGSIAFADREQGGARVYMRFDMATLDNLAGANAFDEEGEADRPPQLTRNSTD
ncbi:MAG: ATP-binding protein [Parasphingopyxis sp.]